MALAVGTNSWVTVAEADTYLTNKVKSTDWFALISASVDPGDESRENYLVTAFMWLYRNELLDIPLSSTDDSVKAAQIEAAYYLLKYGDEYNRRQSLIGSGVKSFTRSEWSEDLSNISLPSNIMGMLAAYVTGTSIVQLYPEDYDF